MCVIGFCGHFVDQTLLELAIYHWETLQQAVERWLTYGVDFSVGLRPATGDEGAPSLSTWPRADTLDLRRETLLRERQSMALGSQVEEPVVEATITDEKKQEPKVEDIADNETSGGRMEEEESSSEAAINLINKKIPMAKPLAKFQPFVLPPRRKVIFAATKK